MSKSIALLLNHLRTASWVSSRNRYQIGTKIAKAGQTDVINKRLDLLMLCLTQMCFNWTSIYCAPTSRLTSTPPGFGLLLMNDNKYTRNPIYLCWWNNTAWLATQTRQIVVQAKRYLARQIHSIPADIKFAGADLTMRLDMVRFA